jgi:hypothetical protein
MGCFSRSAPPAVSGCTATTNAKRVAAMRRLLEDGLSAAEAARAVLAGAQPSERMLDAAAGHLLEAIRGYDEAAVQAVLDESLAAFALETVLRELILPTLVQIGREWEAETLDVSQEHFASNLIRGRLLAFARLWDRGAGPRALLACVPGEAHDISLMAFGLVLAPMAGGSCSSAPTRHSPRWRRPRRPRSPSPPFSASSNPHCSAHTPAHSAAWRKRSRLPSVAPEPPTRSARGCA